MLRHLQQFPALRNGLSRAERQIVELAESGLHEFRELSPAAQKLEESIWMGDDTFLRYLQGLVSVRQPLLPSQNSSFDVTAFGKLVLQGKEDHVNVNGIDRWLGGVHLHDGAPVWRWDEATETVHR